MSSLKLRKLDASKSESLLGTIGSREHVQTRKVLSLKNGCKAARIIIAASELILFVILWCLYISKSQSQVLNEYLIQSPLLTLTYMEAYYWIQNIVQSTMIILCMIFFIEFILYTDHDWIHEVKKAREEAKLHSHSQYGAQVLPKRTRINRNQTIAINDLNLCRILCSFSFCCRRVGVAIANILTVTWSELHSLCMITCIYYLLSVTLRLYHSKIRSPKSLFIINDAVTAFGIILPPFAYSLCAKLKIIYDQGFVDDETVAGSVWEKDTKLRWYRSSSQMSIVQASKSILNDKFIKVWMFLMYLFQLIIFITEPILGPDKFRYFLNTMYDCWKAEGHLMYACDPTTSQIVFTVHILVLRIGVPLLLLNTVFSFIPRSSHSSQVMHYNHFHEILTPSAIILVVLNAFLSNYFLFKHYSIVTWGWTCILFFFSVWELFIFTQSLKLAETAEDDHEQFYGFTTDNKASLFNYFCKGILLLLLWTASFIALMLCKGTGQLSSVQQNQISRQIPSIIFSITSMLLLVPLQKVAISPTYRDYFRRKNRIRYLVTFHMICLLCIVFIVQKFILILSFYFEIITDERNMKNAAFATSFALSFASIGFHIWLFGKYSGILYPVVPKIGSPGDIDSVKAESATRMSPVYGRKKRESKERKDSKMSLTALYQNRTRTPSIPREYDEESSCNINHQQRTRSLSQKQKSYSIDSDKSAKATSMSQRKMVKTISAEYEDKIETWNDAAKIYGLKSHSLYDVEQIASFAVDPNNSKKKFYTE
eukprot:270670_1